MTSTILRPGHASSDTHRVPAGSDPSASSDHSLADTQDHPVAAGTNLRPGHKSSETQLLPAGSDPSPTTPARSDATPRRNTPGWLELRLWAEMFDDAQKARIAQTNRAERGGVDPDIYEPHLERIRIAEHQCGLSMRRTYRRVVPAPIVAWQKASNGIGEHLLARLLGQIGDPVWATPHHWEGTGAARVLVTDPPFQRTVGQLWQYCGHGASSRKTKGMSAADLAAMGNPSTKMILHLLAEACMKTRSSPYRLVYEEQRTATTDKTHTVECVRCGPSGKPAAEGSPWSLGHQHAHALRIVGKEILRDLWIVGGGSRSAS